jgi:Exonuclease VII small subunit
VVKEETISYEQAFLRLEAILEKMNTGAPPLEEAVTLYEEADRLITLCQKKLTQAEKKVETLIKTRTGELQLDANQNPEKGPL